MNSKVKPDISFVLPTLNEEEHIGGVIDSIESSIAGRYKYEVRVADNGSTDRTLEIAEARGAICLKSPASTIATARNIGAKAAQADVLVFLDADVYLTPAWGKEIGAVLSKLQSDSKLITGSICGISDADNWIEKIWFAPRITSESVNYMNSGHLIMHRRLFVALGGFDPNLETGEDYDLCVRACARGAQIENNPALRVVHEGYPKELSRFFSRERWHGRGDSQSMRLLLASKPAIISSVNLIVLFFCLLGILVSPESFLFYLLTYFIFIVGVSSAASYHRFKGKISAGFPAAVILYIVYFWARSLSIVDVLGAKLLRKGS